MCATRRNLSLVSSSGQSLKYNSVGVESRCCVKRGCCVERRVERRSRRLTSAGCSCRVKRSGRRFTSARCSRCVKRSSRRLTSTRCSACIERRCRAFTGAPRSRGIKASVIASCRVLTGAKRRAKRRRKRRAERCRRVLARAKRRVERCRRGSSGIHGATRLAIRNQRVERRSRVSASTPACVKRRCRVP